MLSWGSHERLHIKTPFFNLVASTTLVRWWSQMDYWHMRFFVTFSTQYSSWQTSEDWNRDSVRLSLGFFNIVHPCYASYSALPAQLCQCAGLLQCHSDSSNHQQKEEYIVWHILPTTFLPAFLHILTYFWLFSHINEDYEEIYSYIHNLHIWHDLIVFLCILSDLNISANVVYSSHVLCIFTHICAC